MCDETDVILIKGVEGENRGGYSDLFSQDATLLMLQPLVEDYLPEGMFPDSFFHHNHTYGDVRRGRIELENGLKRFASVLFTSVYTPDFHLNQLLIEQNRDYEFGKAMWPILHALELIGVQNSRDELHIRTGRILTEHVASFTNLVHFYDERTNELKQIMCELYLSHKSRFPQRNPYFKTPFSVHSPSGDVDLDTAMMLISMLGSSYTMPSQKQEHQVLSKDFDSRILTYTSHFLDAINVEDLSTILERGFQSRLSQTPELANPRDTTKLAQAIAQDWILRYRNCKELRNYSGSPLLSQVFNLQASVFENEFLKPERKRRLS